MSNRLLASKLKKAAASKSPQPKLAKPKSAHKPKTKIVNKNLYQNQSYQQEVTNNSIAYQNTTDDSLISDNAFR